MARPLKSGLDYFPLDVDIDQDDKVAMIEAIHGIEGFGVLIKILMKVYKEGYYYEWTNREQILFSKRINVDINKVNEIVNDCIKEGIFDKDTFHKHSILTSKGIQERFLEATKRRKNDVRTLEYNLVSVNLHQNAKSSESALPGVNVNNNAVNVDINSQEEVVNVDISTQSKVKESKVLKDKVSQDDTYPYERIIDYLNRRVGSSFSVNSEETKKLIRARFQQGANAEDFKTVIDKKWREWHNNPKMVKYLRPKTLFGKTNFNEYLGEAELLPESNKGKVIENKPKNAMELMLQQFNNGGIENEESNENDNRLLISENVSTL